MQEEMTPTPACPDHHARQTTTPLRVLIVEDMEDDASLLLLELQRAGWDVTHQRVEDAAAMTAALSAHPWDIIISDYSMPHFSGIASLEVARKRARDLPFILVSGTVGEEVAVEAMKAGANDYLFKGNLKRLAAAVKRELRDSQGRREARRVALELEHRERQLADAQRLAHLGSWIFDFRTDAIICSEETSRILNCEPADALITFQAFVNCLHPEDRPQFIRSLKESKLNQFANDYRVLHTGGVRFVHVRWDIVRDANSAPLEATGMIQDITERKLVEQQLRKAHDDLAVANLAAEAAKDAAQAANRAKDNFLAILSHELRTPLTPVLLTVSLLEKQSDLTEEMREDIGTIRRHVELEARLIDDLLDVTRITQGKLQLNVETTDVHAVIQNALKICCPNRMGDITLTLEARRHHVRADPARLLQVFWNLISNAVKFTPPGKSIAIRSSNIDDRRIRIEVLDAGIGIDPRILPRIFNAFEQGDTSLTRNFGGLGLGLTIAKALVEAIDGTITARSDGNGQGTCLTVDMPTLALPTPQPSRPSPTTLPASGSRRLRILLVEDHDATRAVMAKLLKSLGYEVKEAASVAEALSLAQRERLDLLISDLGLPDGSGHDVMRAMKARYAINGIAVSGFGMDSDIQKSVESGFAKHLVKPIDVDKLQLAIQQTVALAKPTSVSTAHVLPGQ